MRYSIHARTATEPPIEISPPTKQVPLLQHEAPKPRRPVVPIIFILLVLAAGAGWLMLRRARTGGSSGDPGTVTARTGDFVKVLRLAGTTNAVRSRALLAPTLEGQQLASMVITELTAAGTRVKKGDVLVEFDPQAQLKDVLDKRGAYQDLLDQVAQKRADEETARAKDETELKQAEDDLKKAQLEVGKNDIVSRIDAEKNEETLQEDEATFKQLQQTLKLKREAAAADIASLEIQAGRAKETMLYAQSNAQEMTLTAPMDGVVVLNMIWTGGRMGEAQEGDQVRPGQSFMKVVDPSEMDVSVRVNQADYLSLQIGQRARVYLDAYPGLGFVGKLEELTPLAHAGQFSDKVRTFMAVFSIEGSNPKLMPDLSAAVDVELGSQEAAVVVPVQSVGIDSGREVVWARDGSGFSERTVKTGARNDLDVVIESGLKSGDVIRREAARRETANSKLAGAS